MTEDIVTAFFGSFAREDVVSAVCSPLLTLDEAEFDCTVADIVYRLYLSEYAQKLPPSPRYRIRVLSDIIKSLESSGRALPDFLYSLHARLSSAHWRDVTDGHVTYQLTADRRVVILEDKYLLAETTGVRTWQAGKTLTDWYMTRPECIENRRVLELGAGLGFTGLSICRVCSPESYIITDGHPLVIKRLKHNVEINSGISTPFPSGAGFNQRLISADSVISRAESAVSSAVYREDGDFQPRLSATGDLSVDFDGVALTVATLDWEKFSAEDARKMEVDLILAADVSYSPQLHEPFVRTVSLLLTSVTSRRPPEVILALTDRNETTTAHLMKELGRQNLKAVLLATPANIQSSFRMEESSKVKIYHIEVR